MSTCPRDLRRRCARRGAHPPRVALLAQQRLAGVEADANPDRPIGKAGRHGRGRTDGAIGRVERDEKGVALGVDLDATFIG